MAESFRGQSKPLINRQGWAIAQRHKKVRITGIASATSLTFSVTSGGAICMAIVGILAIFMVKFRKYDVQTNEFAVAQRLKREKATSEDENS